MVRCTCNRQNLERLQEMACFLPVHIARTIKSIYIEKTLCAREVYMVISLALYLVSILQPVPAHQRYLTTV
jgi:hypothetical protein